MTRSAANDGALPPFYHDFALLDALEHEQWTTRIPTDFPCLVGQSLVPLTLDEFEIAHRHYPIVFSTGPMPIPLALMGLLPGTNVFVDAEGKPASGIYIPAYARRYPWLLHAIDGDPHLGFDPTCDLVARRAGNLELVRDGQFTAAAKDFYRFCEIFADAWVRTRAFADELDGLGLLIDGTTTIERASGRDPQTFGGFQIIDAARFVALKGTTLASWCKRDLLMPVCAQRLSLSLFGDLFNRHIARSDPGFAYAAMPEPTFGSGKLTGSGL